MKELLIKLSTYTCIIMLALYFYAKGTHYTYIYADIIMLIGEKTLIMANNRWDNFLITRSKYVNSY